MSVVEILVYQSHLLKEMQQVRLLQPYSMNNDQWCSQGWAHWGTYQVHLVLHQVLSWAQGLSCYYNKSYWLCTCTTQSQVLNLPVCIPASLVLRITKNSVSKNFVLQEFRSLQSFNLYEFLIHSLMVTQCSFKGEQVLFLLQQEHVLRIKALPSGFQNDRPTIYRCIVQWL